MTPLPMATDYPFGFHVTREAMERFGLVALVSDGAATERGIMTYRMLAEAVTDREGGDAEPPLAAGELLCASLLSDVNRHLWSLYFEEQEPSILAALLADIGEGLVKERVDCFVESFPPVAAEPPVGDAVLVEAVQRWLQEDNPAFGPLLEIFGLGPDDEYEARTGLVRAMLARLDEAPPFELLGQPLSACLRAPARAHPDSLEAQLEWVLQHWTECLPESLLGRLTLAGDLRREEQFERGGEPGPSLVLDFAPVEDDGPMPAAFSEDADWMPNVVMVAKSTYVWLYQLSETYGRAITRLDQVPDEELDKLARWGVSGLWLIGLWERSGASRRIKQMMGNPEAAASAYSLDDYRIVEELGGDEAYWNLKERAWRRGIRMAGDMVPNHMGLDSSWVVHHPERFTQVPYAPYPNYRFTGADLCEHPDVSLRLEDGYWDHSDAAVVFQRVDNRTGEVAYIYHGNDGTSMPWNDTAQLDFSKSEVREAVIQTILHVARRFPIIRFDAAMTLAKKHIQRLWYPKPGDEGTVPSRTEHGMSRAEFDQHVPVEFWREVVDRVAEEVPDTLLLAEAFWLMEGYFVRTLGMHRVYNSAFMNMLKMEENSKYRSSMRNVLEFDPAILERFVNFMNNPDERTAVEQFGKGDKYFGVAMLMVTMPGLPMIGHGQVEGLTEKYGMEYKRAYYDEQPDEDLVRRHEREIFPLMRRRRLFSGVEHFALYDLHNEQGRVQDSVFAYSNRAGGERALIVFNNAYEGASGRIRRSCPANRGSAEEPALVSLDLCEALELPRSSDQVCLLRDHVTQQTRVVSCVELSERGLRLDLSGYRYHAFVDIRVVHDYDGAWRQLAQQLGDGAVQDPFAAVQDIRTAGLQDALGRLLHAWVHWDGAVEPPRFGPLQGELAKHGFTGGEDDLLAEAALRTLARVYRLFDAPPPLAVFAGISKDPAARGRTAAVVAAYALLSTLRGRGWTGSGSERPLPKSLRLERAIARALEELGGSGWDAARDARLLTLLLELDLEDDWPGAEGVDRDLSAWLGVNEYQGVTYFDRQQLEGLLFWWQLLAVLPDLEEADRLLEAAAQRANRASDLLAAAEAAGWRLDALV